MVDPTLRLRLAAMILCSAWVSARSPSCGNTERRSLGERSYLLRLPAGKSCGATLRSMPLLVTIHCYGCDAEMELVKWREDADAHGFAIASPEGIGHSFHAPHCCGPARESNVDDVSFIDLMVTEVISERGSPPLSSRAIFVTGFSNGGFMASHLVSLAGKSQTRWAAVATMAGHEYSVSRTQPLPVSMHHCATDHVVNASGCCLEGGQPTCCCGIVADQCVSAAALHSAWFVTNQCTSMRRKSGAAGSQCLVGVGCAAETSLCLYYGCHHAQWSHSFPATGEVMRFFSSIAGRPTVGAMAHSQGQHVLGESQPDAKRHQHVALAAPAAAGVARTGKRIKRRRVT